MNEPGIRFKKREFFVCVCESCVFINSTTFGYGNLKLSATKASPGDALTATQYSSMTRAVAEINGSNREPKFLVIGASAG